MYLRDFWYIGGWSSEVSRLPMRRLIMSEPIAFYRRGNGAVAAIEDRCPHRNFPLSKGELIGDTIQCGYHGLVFGPDGRCVHAPGQDRAPASASIKAYPVEERSGIVWIWMGDAGAARREQIPDLSWLENSGWTPWIDGYIHLKCNHRHLTENLLDISHLAYVHKSSMGSDPDLFAKADTKVTPKATGVVRRVRLRDMPTPPVYRASSLVDDRIDQWTESEMRPGLYQNHVRIRPAHSEDWAEDADAPLQNRSFHGIVPETETSTHYFHGGGRLNVDVETMTGERAHKILEEDVDVLESIQNNELYVGDRPTVNLRNDMTVMQWRAIVKGMQCDRAA